ncbi:hypothetical protein [Microseira wollei]|uniref:Uncharacterized protein n=1 Tax=Microseira wollei NIES-4236 TaxID=2530354 RepID=A0AAV3XHZ8_9CYAN|nr:hypothetical protein [Microseira wollei]GET40590.1 hypothetical protein MiSe_54000 [Microseira wollei NIES-4236]
MNSDNLILLLQQGFRISLGATASLVETLQDDQKRSETLSQLGSQLIQLTQEWSEKGEITEQEARSYVDSLLRQQTNQTTSATPPTARTSPATPNPAAATDVQLEIQELIAQIAAMRAELENLRSQDDRS